MAIVWQICNAFWRRAAAVAAVLWVAGAARAAEGSVGLANTTILIIRHAEKAERGGDLSEAGYRRAGAYVKYFASFEVDSTPVRINGLIAAADSKNSRRPRETLEPLAHALGLPIDRRFKDKDADGLAAELKEGRHGRCLLICWHHGEIPDLLRALGAAPGTLLPRGKWPGDQYGWLILLRYDGEGNWIPAQCRRIEENIH